MEKAKPGAVFLAAIVALVGIGIGYAAWTDELTIKGTITTGTVDIDIVGYSGTYVYKTPNHGMVIVHQFYDRNGGPTIGDWYIYSTDGGQTWTRPQLGKHSPPDGYELIAYTDVTEIKDKTNTVFVEYYNLFPCVTFGVDLLLHYTGSIPARVSVVEFTTKNKWLQYLVDNGHAWDEAYFVNISGCPNNPPQILWNKEVDIGTQVHECDYVGLALLIHLPQDDNLQGRTGRATYHVEVVQWNEYEE